MEGYFRTAIVLTLLLLLPVIMSARHIGPKHSRHGHYNPTLPNKSEMAMVKPDLYGERKRMKHRRPDTLQIAGSSLPDCSHACGSCSPCRLVMVSFVCASIEEAETCPMAYKCLCNNKSYPVP